MTDGFAAALEEATQLFNADYIPPLTPDARFWFALGVLYTLHEKKAGRPSNSHRKRMDRIFNDFFPIERMIRKGEGASVPDACLALSRDRKEAERRRKRYERAQRDYEALFEGTPYATTILDLYPLIQLARHLDVGPPSPRVFETAAEAIEALNKANDASGQ